MRPGDVCPRCMSLAARGKIDAECVQPMRGGALDALARDGSGKCCSDCAFADRLLGGGMDFEMARIAVGNDRRDQYRLPGAPLGLVLHGLKPSEPGDLEAHYDWLETHGLIESEES